MTAESFLKELQRLIYSQPNPPLRIINSENCDYGNYLFYSKNLLNCFYVKNSLGCVGMSHKQYCILNRQLTKEEYEKRSSSILRVLNASNSSFDTLVF